MNSGITPLAGNRSFLHVSVTAVELETGVGDVRHAVSLKAVLDDRAVVVQSVEDVALQLSSASTAQGCPPLNEATNMHPRLIQPYH